MKRGWVMTALLTTLIYPLLYGEAHRWGPNFYLPTSLAVVRNVVLITATVRWLLQNREKRRQSTRQVVASVPGRPPRRALSGVAPTGLSNA